MPIYEYRCTHCKRRSSHFFRSVSAAEVEVASLICPHCQDSALTRLPSRFAVHGAEGERLDAMADESMLRALESDNPRAAAEMMRRMSSALGEPMDDATQDLVDRLDAGDVN